MMPRSKTGTRRQGSTPVVVAMGPEEASAALRALRSGRPAGRFKGCLRLLAECLRGYLVAEGGRGEGRRRKDEG